MIEIDQTFCLTQSTDTGPTRPSVDGSCSDERKSCHDEIEIDQPFCLTQSQGTDTGPTHPSVDPNRAKRPAEETLSRKPMVGSHVHDRSWCQRRSSRTRDKRGVGVVVEGGGVVVCWFLNSCWTIDKS